MSLSKLYYPNSSELELVLFVSNDSRDCGCKDDCFCLSLSVNLLEQGYSRTGSFFFITVLSFLFCLLNFLLSVRRHNLSRSCFISLERLGLYFFIKYLFEGLESSVFTGGRKTFTESKLDCDLNKSFGAFMIV